MKIPCPHDDKPRAGYGACSSCYSAWYRSTPQGYEVAKKARKKYNSSVKGKAAQKRWRDKYQKTDKGIAAHKRWWWRVGGVDPSFTYDQYLELEKQQRGLCSICGGKTKGKRLNVDHDHKTGQVRGLICSTCNHRYVSTLDKLLNDGILDKVLLHIGCGESVVREVIADLMSGG